MQPQRSRVRVVHSCRRLSAAKSADMWVEPAIQVVSEHCQVPEDMPERLTALLELLRLLRIVMRNHALQAGIGLSIHKARELAANVPVGRLVRGKATDTGSRRVVWSSAKRCPYPMP